MIFTDILTKHEKKLYAYYHLTDKSRKTGLMCKRLNMKWDMLHNVMQGLIRKMEYWVNR